jgi:hypothetical protein
MAKGTDYGYGQIDGSYIKPKKIDGKYWIQNKDGGFSKVPRPRGGFKDVKNTVANKRATKAGGRAQPKGTQPKGMARPPRTGPGSGAGGQSARYSRLTGSGLAKHGR